MGRRKHRLRSIAAAAALAACLAAWPAGADVVEVYRCVDGDGAVSLQDRPCPAGSTAERRRLRVEPGAGSVPGNGLDRAPEATAAAPPEPTADGPSPARAPAPPSLWDCVRHDGSRYESDDGVPQRHWVPLWVLGRDPRAPPSLFGRNLAPGPPGAPPAGGPRPPRLPPAQGLALEAGMWVEDRCLPLPPASVCARLSERRARLLHAWRLGMPSDRARLRPQLDALAQTLRASCAG